MYGDQRHLYGLPGKWSPIKIGLLMLVAWLLVPVNSFAEIATLDEFKAFGEKFDHLTTGFALTGEHTNAECGDCHIGGVFETLPRECDACHDNVIATGKNANHIQTNQPCDVCHNTGAFLVAAIMDHSITEGNCVSCHDGVSATGKSAFHISSTDVCDACHSVSFWVPVLTVDHEQTLGSCSQCHNGIIATGKSPSHAPTTDDCEACHLATAGSDWPAFQVDHARVLGACSFCHQRPNGHISTTDTCNACHQTAPEPWEPVPNNAVDHAHVIGSCSSCHDGVVATGKSPSHITSTDTCNACHQPAPTPWQPVPNSAVNHDHVIGACSSCHDGVVATGKPNGHISTTEECNACHLVPPNTFAGATVPTPS